MLKSFVILVIIIFTLTLTGCNNSNNENSIDNSQAGRLSATLNDTNNNQINITKNATEETEVSSYTTKMLDDTPARVNNIKITCDLINGKVINPGETFSYYETVGKATEEKGYKEATVLDSEGNKTQGIGGGNCQVSSTIYCAVLEIPSFEVVERHAHVKPVAYVPKGKDATISYGSCDFKFKNNADYPIKMYATANEKEVTIKINKVG